ncbi:hypothetical protein KI387_008457, partial [Taxus chinensis]
ELSIRHMQTHRVETSHSQRSQGGAATAGVSVTGQGGERRHRDQRGESAEG